ncbi:MAG: sulfite exporter TauE/SafE family protein [Ruminococcus sp.]|nr:sulfite exporter TauE/SafE family protein [Ruminococcus sp.]
MTDFLITTIISIASGAAAAMGLGGGTFLIVYLTVFAGINQTAAQGINLVFFIPCAALALWYHTKSGLVIWKAAVPALIAGSISAALFSILANSVNESMSKKLFGAFILIMGMKTLSQKRESGDKT